MLLRNSFPLKSFSTICADVEIAQEVGGLRMVQKNATWSIVDFVGHDKFGRTLIQVSSALSEKWPVIEWLLKQKKVEINPRNAESGYTVSGERVTRLTLLLSNIQALHYSVFYGRIDNAVNLIKVACHCLPQLDAEPYLRSFRPVLTQVYWTMTT